MRRYDLSFGSCCTVFSLNSLQTLQKFIQLIVSNVLRLSELVSKIDEESESASPLTFVAWTGLCFVKVEFTDKCKYDTLAVLAI